MPTPKRNDESNGTLSIKESMTVEHRALLVSTLVWCSAHVWQPHMCKRIPTKE